MVIIKKSLIQTPEEATNPARAPFSMAICVKVTKIGPSSIAKVRPNITP